MKYTEEEKKQLRALLGRILDREDETGSIEIMEIEGDNGTPSIARKRFHISITKIGNVERR